MPSFETFEYDIKSRLPEWWKDDKLAIPINEYTQDLISKILETLLTSFGVVQPINVWKTIPEEYNWFHHYTLLDDYLLYNRNGVKDHSVCTFFPNSVVEAYVPNTRRKCNAKIHLRLLGENLETRKPNIDKLTITNGNQTIIIRNVSKTATIDILTEQKKVLIDGKIRNDLVTGFFEEIQPTIKYPDFRTPSEDNEEGIEFDLEYENKETKIVFDSEDQVNFDLQIYLLRPTYVTEQNIRIATVSAFPIEWVRLYGYYCNPFNNKQGYKFLWEKKYSIQSRTVYDRITKPFNCERFFVQVKFHGIGTHLTKGFPQDEISSNACYHPNSNLDKWGKIYGLPRRRYRTDIKESEEPYTYPKYYNYPIEQDYWYEERLVNEYRFDDEAINSNYIKDSDLNNIARLDYIHPSTDEVWVYTETIDASNDDLKSQKNIKLHDIKEIDQIGVEIKNFESIGSSQKNTEVTEINPYNSEILKLNDSSYKTRKYKCSFCLNQYKQYVPKDIKIKGIELSFKANRHLQSNSLRIDDDSYMILPFYSRMFNEFKIEKVNISGEHKFWNRNDEYYTIGGEDFLFGESEITREQLFSGNNGLLEFEIGFINESKFLKADLCIEDIRLNIYYETIPDKYKIESKINNRKIVLNKNEEINLSITVTNESDKEIENKELFIILPNELKFKTGSNHYTWSFNLDEPQSFTINTVIEPVSFEGVKKTGYYDILIFCEDKEIKEQILVRSKE